MILRDLYERLRLHFGPAADPDVWWPIFHGVSQPPEFERTITNILVQNSTWRPVRVAVAALHRQGLLTAAALAQADEETLAACVQPTGLQTQKARRLQTVGAWIVERFGSEAAFCAGVTRARLLDIPGIGPETADRTLLYTCRRCYWPVDTYCVRVLARSGVIAAEPADSAAKRRLAGAIKALVEAQLPANVDDWQRLHALVQLEGERHRREGTLLGGS